MDTTQYSGWSLYEKIILVVKQNASQMGYNQAYIVDPKNSKSLETARSWGETYAPGIHDRTIIKPEEFLFDNKDFEIELYSAASSSSMSGKLSFWNCIIRKDGREFLIGINADLLLQLLRQSECLNGRITQKVEFARNGSTVGVLHPEMKQYKQAKNDEKLKEKMSKKTSKHEVGKSYSTLTKTNIYLGDVYQWFEYTKGSSRKGFRDIDLHKFKLLDEPLVKHMFVDTFYLRDLDLKEIGSIAKLYKHLESNLDNYIERVNTGKTDYSSYYLLDGAVILRNRQIADKLPSRTVGEISLSTEGKADIGILINKIRLNALKFTEKRYSASHDYMIDIFGYSDNKATKPLYTEEQQLKILSLFNDDVVIDFGDGKERKGTFKA